MLLPKVFARYVMDATYREASSVGEAVGMIAAQSIGTGTQLTMRTFHVGELHK